MKTIGFLFGGKSPEHEISILSTRAILKHLDRSRFAPVLFPVTRDGTLFEGDGGLAFLAEGDERNVAPAAWDRLRDMDVVFPVFHGPYGEDGTIQGLLAFLDVPYVGCGVEASALNMHKGVFRDLFAWRNVPQPAYRWFTSVDRAAGLESVRRELSLPLFVKPCRGGSSIGISKVVRTTELEPAVDRALALDQAVIVEEAVPVTEELEVAVLGTPADPLVSRPGKLIPGDVFYTYEDKYTNSRTRFDIPASDLDEHVAEQVRRLADLAFRATGCFGLARVDFLYDRRSGRLALNEVNTMPGFTEISMYPKLIMDQGISFTELITRLIDLSAERVLP